ncbi:hypothetical protein LJC29_07490 [Bacteroides sp. OttesenSCG-928-N06]|nr:hypothetical protein [Bacteroides sp. OttesenSCG-928-N06]
MDSFWEVLLILGFIGIGIFKQVSNSFKEKTDEQRPIVPLGMEEVFPDVPLLQPEPTPTVAETGSVPTANKFKQKLHKTIPIETNATPLQEAESPPQNFDVHSIDEVRKGIIWSEILNRKY